MKKTKSSECGMAPAAQKASLSVPASVKSHKNPEMKPIGDHAKKGVKTK